MDAGDRFSDDDLDDIPENALDDLENHAISLTQHQNGRSRTTSEQPSKKLAHDATSFNKPAARFPNPPWKPPHRSQQVSRQNEATAPPPSALAPPSSDYGFDDEEDVIDLDGPSAIGQPSSGLAIRNNAQTGRPDVARSRLASDPETEAIFAAADAEMGTIQRGRWDQAPYLAPSVNDGLNMQSLQARIATLEAEQDRLRQSEKEARDSAIAKQGEIAIVRANHDKVTKEYERRLLVMRRLHADEAAKQKAEIENSRKEREKMETDNRFLKHDLAQDALALRKPNNVSRSGVGSQRPKDSPRSRKSAVGDGFADGEVSMMSPSKSRERSVEQTPRAGAKRKRIANDSPSAPLSFSHPVEASRERSAQSSFAADPVTLAVTTAKQDDRFELVQRIIDYRPHHKHQKTVETLMTYHFPSNVNQSLSAILLESLASLRHDGEAAPLAITRVLLRMWLQCLNEKYYEPLKLTIDLIRFILDSELPSTCAVLIEEAVPICIWSVETVDSLRARTARALDTNLPANRDVAGLNTTTAVELNREEQQKFAHEIQLSETLDFLHDLAQASTLKPERNETFWRVMTCQVTLLMLNKANPLEEVISGLQILGTSCLPTTFAAVSDDIEKQAKQENFTIEQLVRLLLETPNAPADQPPYDDEELAELQLEVLKIIRKLCMTDHGSLLLARHRNAIGRLFQCLDMLVRRLYKLEPSPCMPKEADKRASEEISAQELTVQSVNLIVRILYHLLQTHSNSIDLQQTFSAIHGGYHKFLVGMTRIAFTEQLVFERGIESEVVEAAHTILDNILSPEEGEAVVRAVETPRGTNKSTEAIELDNTHASGDTNIVDAPD